MRHKNTLLGVVSLGVLLATALVFRSTEKPTVPTLQDQTTAVARHMAHYSQRTEKEEGCHDLVKDAVRMKTTANGKRIIEQVGETTFYESAGDRDNRFRTLVRQVAVEDPAWLWNFITFLRGEAKALYQFNVA